MHYTINISLNGYHLFATADHSLCDTQEYIRCFAILKAKFPESEGYKVDGTLWKTIGNSVNDSGDKN
jgi:hypothetical protein